MVETSAAILGQLQTIDKQYTVIITFHDNMLWLASKKKQIVRF